MKIAVKKPSRDNTKAAMPTAPAQHSAGLNRAALPHYTPQTLQMKSPPRKAPTGGLPAQLKSGIESLSGVSMDGVKVHYNSSRPKTLGAEAYAQGRDIHLGPGKENHLPHEAWHLVQQAQGRVKPTLQMKDGPAVNDHPGLEREADLMGAKAMHMSNNMAEVSPKKNPIPNGSSKSALQQKTLRQVTSKNSSFAFTAMSDPTAVFQLGKSKQEKQKAAAAARKKREQSRADRAVVKAAKYSGDMMKQATKGKSAKEVKEATKGFKGHASKKGGRKQNAATQKSLKDIQDRLKKKDDDRDRGGAGGGIGIPVQ